VFDERGVTSALQVAAGIEWLVMRGVRLINLSLGLREDRPALREACAAAQDAGVSLDDEAPLAELAGCGATVPLLGFGHLLAKGVRTALQEEGAIGILTGGLTAAAAGITTSLVCGVVCSWIGRSHDQN
jgi:hypothetical protein